MNRATAASDHETAIAISIDPGMRESLRAIRAAIREIEPDLPMSTRLMQKWIDEVTTEIRNFVALILPLGVLATVLSAAGICGAVSFAVNQGRREYGIRAALGAQRMEIVRSIYSSGGRPLARGLLVGLSLSVATGAALSNMLSSGALRVDGSDPLLYLAAVLLLAGAATAATLLPAQRGANLDPIEALKCD